MSRLAKKNLEAASTSLSLFLGLETLRMIAGYAHWIPITRGIHREFFDTKNPGWEWNDIIPVLFRKKVIDVNRKEPGFVLLSQGLFISLAIVGVTLSKGAGSMKVWVHTVDGVKEKVNGKYIQ